MWLGWLDTLVNHEYVRVLSVVFLKRVNNELGHWDQEFHGNLNNDPDSGVQQLVFSVIRPRIPMSVIILLKMDKYRGREVDY